MKIIFRYGGAVISLILCAVLLGGCGSSTSILKAGEGDESECFVASEDASEEGFEGQSDEANETVQTEVSDSTENADAAKESGAAEDQQVSEDARQIKQIYVDIQGAVQAPGVYQLPEGSRVFQAIEMAGGITDEAAVELVNQAGILEDGQQIHIFTKEEAEEIQKEQTLRNENGASADNTAAQSDGPVNINRADKEALMTLTGIGETRAEAILAYREANGGFSCKEDLMQVEGIKGKTYEKLKDQITVD